MGGTSYNGYDWKQRAKIIPAFRRLSGKRSPFEEHPCAMCGDPNRPPGNWHSEDYSEPFTFQPPESYPLCNACHGRLHKRFNAPPGEWELFCRHLETGGYGSEFVKLFSASQRRALANQISAGQSVKLDTIRPRTPGPWWWRNLTLDTEALDAPWARPRPLRPRPEAEAFSAALKSISISEREERLLSFHANAERRTATMRQLANGALGVDKPSAANLVYGRLARRICISLDWNPDTRPDGTPIWMSMVAEGWQPPRREGEAREFEWVMVPSLASIWRS